MEGGVFGILGGAGRASPRSCGRWPRCCRLTEARRASAACRSASRARCAPSSAICRMISRSTAICGRARSWTIWARSQAGRAHPPRAHGAAIRTPRPCRGGGDARAPPEPGAAPPGRGAGAHPRPARAAARRTDRRPRARGTRPPALAAFRGRHRPPRGAGHPATGRCGSRLRPRGRAGRRQIALSGHAAGDGGARCGKVFLAELPEDACQRCAAAIAWSASFRTAQRRVARFLDPEGAPGLAGPTAPAYATPISSA